RRSGADGTSAPHKLMTLLLGQLPGFVEQARVEGFRIVGTLIDLEDREVSVAGRGEIAGPVGPGGGQSAVDDHIMARAQRARIDQSRRRLSGGEALAAQRYGLLGPMQYGQLAVELGDPVVTAGIPEEDHVVSLEISRGDVAVVFDADMAAVG